MASGVALPLHAVFAQTASSSDSTQSTGSSTSTGSSGTSSTATAAAAAAAQAATVPPPNFIFTPSVSLSESFTDNVGLTSNNEQSDWLTTLTGGFDSSYRTERTLFSGNYSVSQDLYAKSSNLDGYTQNLLAAGHTEPIKDHLTVDLRASLEQTAISQLQAVSATTRTTPSNQTQTLNVGLTPQYTQRFSDWGIGNLSYSINRVIFLSPSVGSNAGAPEAATTHDITASLSNGPRFTQLLWQLAATGTYSQSSGTQLVDRTGSAHAEYRVDRYVGVPVTVGYDRYTGGGEGFNSGQVSGLFWDAGLHLTPGPRTDLTATYGRRYGGSDWNGAFLYKITPSIMFRAVYQTALQTQQQALASELNQLSVDSNGNIVDPIAGQVSSLQNTTASLAQSPFVEHQFQFGITGTRGRNTLALTGGVTDQTFRGTQPNQSSKTLSFNYTRALSQLANLVLIIDPTRSSIDGVGTSTSIEASIALNYAVSDKTTATFQVSRQRQYGTLSVQEDVILATISRKF